MAETFGGQEALDAALSEGRLRLIARGWVYPTDSSINVAISQGEHTPPIDLSLEAPVANPVNADTSSTLDSESGSDEEWYTVGSRLGFPAGKHKHLLIDISDALADQPAEGPWKLRLRTTMAIYWDHIQAAALDANSAAELEASSEAAGEAVASELPFKTELLDPASADLLDRGFSVTNRLDGTGRVSEPETPDYDQIYTRNQLWLNLEGFHTRFGDVMELIRETDDRYVIMNAGDEIRLKFDVPDTPLPEGWVRDYVFITDGWVKDGDLNTAYSTTVRPLPSHDRPEYTLPDADAAALPLEEDPAYLANPEDWEVYHTRYVSPHPFQKLMLRKDY